MAVFDGRDVAAGLRGEEPSGSADPRAGVEHAVFSAHTGEFDELHGRDPAERVEILERREILR